MVGEQHKNPNNMHSFSQEVNQQRYENGEREKEKTGGGWVLVYLKPRSRGREA